ncbi:MAG: hypothetical protein NXI30_02645 [bacterium]|nr:hypothetical protein [bacterium]
MSDATLKSFDTVNGFGVLELDDGREVPFDISSSNKREPRPGDRASVTVGTSRVTGKPRATLVLFELEEDRAPSFADGFKQVQSEGLLPEWTLADARRHQKDTHGSVPRRMLRGDLGDLLLGYYGEGLSRRGERDGIWLSDWRANVEIAQQALATLSGIPPEPGALSDLLSTVRSINANFRQAGSDSRLLMLDFEGDFFTVMFRDRGFVDRCRELILFRFDPSITIDEWKG